MENCFKIDKKKFILIRPDFKKKNTTMIKNYKQKLLWFNSFRMLTSTNDLCRSVSFFFIVVGSRSFLEGLDGLTIGEAVFISSELVVNLSQSSLW